MAVRPRWQIGRSPVKTNERSGLVIFIATAEPSTLEPLKCPASSTFVFEPVTLWWRMDSINVGNVDVSQQGTT